LKEYLCAGYSRHKARPKKKQGKEQKKRQEKYPAKPTLEEYVAKAIDFVANQGADPNVTDKQEQTILHITVAHTAKTKTSVKALSKISKLINKGANINAQDQNHQTPLHLAAKEGSTKVAQLLITFGADIKACDEKNKYFFECSAKPSKFLEDVVKLLPDGDPKQDALKELYSEMLNRDIAQYIAKGWSKYSPDVLMILKANPNLQLSEENKKAIQSEPSLLHEAARCGNSTDAKILLELGTNPNFQDALGRTALCHAATNEHTKVVQVLLEHGANPNIQDKLHATPLQVAARFNAIETVEILLTSGTIDFSKIQDPLDLFKQIQDFPLDQKILVEFAQNLLKSTQDDAVKAGLEQFLDDNPIQDLDAPTLPHTTEGDLNTMGDVHDPGDLS